jgi:uncharacterized membrane protein YfcA
MVTVETQIIISAAVFGGALVSGLAGFSFSAVAGGVILQVLPPVVAVPLLIACAITSQLISIVLLRRSMQWNGLPPLLLGGLAGVPLGAALLQRLDPGSFRFGLGLFLCAYSVILLAGSNLLRAPHPGIVLKLLIGVAGGITAGLLAFPSAIPAAWYSFDRQSKESYRGILHPFIFVTLIASLLYTSKLGLFTGDVLKQFIFCLPSTVGGNLTGQLLFRKIDDRRFRQLVLCFLLLAGGELLV